MSRCRLVLIPISFSFRLLAAASGRDPETFAAVLSKLIAKLFSSIFHVCISVKGPRIRNPMDSTLFVSAPSVLARLFDGCSTGDFGKTAIQCDRMRARGRNHIWRTNPSMHGNKFSVDSKLATCRKNQFIKRGAQRAYGRTRPRGQLPAVPNPSGCILMEPIEPMM